LIGQFKFPARQPYAGVCMPICLGLSAMDSFEMHVNFIDGKVNQLGEEAIPMHRQRAHHDLPIQGTHVSNASHA